MLLSGVEGRWRNITLDVHILLQILLQVDEVCNSQIMQSLVQLDTYLYCLPLFAEIGEIGKGPFKTFFRFKQPERAMQWVHVQQVKLPVV